MAIAARMMPCPHCGGSGHVAESFSDRLKRQREVLGMTQQTLADKVGVSRPQVANLETGRGDPGVQVLIGLSAELHVSIDWLLTGAENSNGE